MHPETCVPLYPLHPAAAPVALAQRVFHAPILPGVQAGFPSPAGDYMEKAIDLNEHLIEHPAATFYVRVTGDSMLGAHIPSGAILIVDRSLKPKNGSIIVAVVDGDFTCKRFEKQGAQVRLLPDSPNHKYKPITLTEEMEAVIWGVVTSIIIDAKIV